MAEASPTLANRPTPGANAQVALQLLLLDDDPFMTRLLGRMLCGLGFRNVSAFDSGADALERVDSSPPDVILCDLNMPGMDGLEFVRHLVERRYSGSLVLVSGENERMLQTAEGLVRAHRLNLLGRLHKPVSVDALAAVLRSWTPPSATRGGVPRKVYAADEIAAAIAAGELANHYQPLVSVATGEVLGAESLVRWHHPRDGIVYPDQFVGVAEECGLVDELTATVLHGAMKQSRRWMQSGLSLRVSVNVSMDNLGSLDFPGLVTGLASATGVAPELLVLEVTESRLAKDLRVPLEVLTRLRLKRFGLSIDDFGTGHSSLAQLHDFPFGELKVDRSFVRNASADPTSRAIYEASLGLARRLNMDVVAEGVETRSDWEFVRRSDCQLAQGYFIARPMPAEQLPDWIAGWTARVRDDGLAPDD